MKAAIRQLLAGSVDPDARAWASAVMAAGGSYSGSTLRAVSAFCRSAKGAGYWSKIDRINLICGNDLTAARVPLLAGGGSATETITNIVSGDYVETGTSAGIKGNGTNKSFDTGRLGSGSASSFGLWAYWKGTEAGGTSRNVIGCTDGTGTLFVGWAVGGTVEAASIATAGTSEYASAATSREGFVGGCTNGSRAQQLYVNGAAVNGTVTATAAMPATRSLYCLATNNNGTAAAFSTRYLRAYAITAGMSAAEVAAFNTHMQAFQTALGRNV